MDHETPERFFKTIRELDMFVRQLDMQSITIGTPGFYQINYGFVSQASLKKISTRNIL